MLQLTALIKRALEYAGSRIGRMKAFQVFMGHSNGEQEVETSARIPLGDRLGYKRIQVNTAAIREAALEEMGEDYGAPVAPYQVIHRHLLEYVREVAPRFGIDPDDITEEMVMGKDNQGWVQVNGSVPMELGNQHWRKVDWLGPPVADGWTVKFKDVNLLTQKEALGDGVIAVLRGETLGLNPTTRDFYQVRAVVKHDGVIHTVGKGIIIVDPDAMDVVAWQDFYGQRRIEGELTFYSMATGSKMNPRSRYTLQGLHYQGIKNWWRYVFQFDNFRAASIEDTRMTEDKLVMANAPIRALGGFGFVSVFTRLAKLSIAAGRSRTLLPAKAFEYVPPFRYLANMEKHDSQNSLKGVPPYYAPERLRSYYRSFVFGGRIERVLNRRPDLSTGQCTRRFRLMGYVPFNAIIIPSWGLTQAGADFDGDLACDFPVPEQGGLYIPFNDLDKKEQELRLAQASVDRKNINGEDGATTSVSGHNYTSVSQRWAGHMECNIILGMSDLNAVRFLVLAGHYESRGNTQKAKDNYAMAHSLKEWTDRSVSRQKRPVPWPHHGGPGHMPKPALPEGYADFATDLVRKVQKGPQDNSGDTPYEKAWNKTMFRAAVLKDITDLEINLLGINQEHVDAIRLWATKLHVASQAMLAEMHMVRDTGRPAPYEVRFPDRIEAKPVEPGMSHMKLRQTVQILDYHWQQAVRLRGDQRRGIFNLKDGLVDAARELGIESDLAEHCVDYSLFRELASVEQLEEYFKDIPGMRLSDMFTLVQGSDFTKDKSDRWVNNCPVNIGFVHFNAGEVRFARRIPSGMTAWVPGTSYPIKACNISDGIIQLKAHLFRDHFKEVEEQLAA